MEEKLKFILKQLQESDCILFDGIPCFFTKCSQNGNIHSLEFDDYLRDDFFKTINVQNIIDIKINNHNILIKTKNNSMSIQILKIKSLAL